MLVFLPSFFLISLVMCCLFFFFNDTSPTAIYTLSLHDALPILIKQELLLLVYELNRSGLLDRSSDPVQQECRDRKSGSAGMPRPISYAVFCLKKKTVKPDRITSEPSEDGVICEATRTIDNARQ